MRNEVEFWPHMEQLWIRFQRLGIIIKLKKVYKLAPVTRFRMECFRLIIARQILMYTFRDPVSLNRESTCLWKKYHFFPSIGSLQCRGDDCQKKTELVIFQQRICLSVHNGVNLPAAGETVIFSQPIEWFQSYAYTWHCSIGPLMRLAIISRPINQFWNKK